MSDWGACSAKCGEGIRKRKVACQIFLEFSKTVATLPDHKCPGPKPPVTEICFAGLCPPKTAPTDGEEDENEHDDVGPSAAAFSSVQMEQPNALSLTIKKTNNYEWKEMGFTDCSESCLGGN